MAVAASAAYWIERLQLTPHPEGGYFRETYRSPELVAPDALPARFPGARAFSTAIYFLLPSNEVSRLHRLRSDELWHFYAGGRVVRRARARPRVVHADHAAHSTAAGGGNISSSS